MKSNVSQPSGVTPAASITLVAEARMAWPDSTTEEYSRTYTSWVGSGWSK